MLSLDLGQTHFRFTDHFLVNEYKAQYFLGFIELQTFLHINFFFLKRATINISYIVSLIFKFLSLVNIEWSPKINAHSCTELNLEILGLVCESKCF